MIYNYFTKHSILALTLLTLAMPFSEGIAQMQYYQATQFFSRFNDINDYGIAVTGGQYFDFETQTFTPIEEDGFELVAINNNGDVAGSMFLDPDLFILQPAYKLNDVWNPIGWFDGINPAESGYSTFAISENSMYVVGQMSDGCCDYGTFHYNTTTETLTPIFDEAYLAVAGYTVNNNGIIGGWADDEGLNGGTRRIPAYITPDFVVHLVPGADDPEFNTNAVNAINNQNIMAGDYDNQPFIFDLATEEIQIFEIPSGPWTRATFTSISENGIAVGYAEYLGDFGSPVRESIIYHPDLGDQPVILQEILAANGILLTTLVNGYMGTPFAISPNGEYVAGLVNDSPFGGAGWVLHFNGLLFVEPVCSIACAEDVTITAEGIDLTAVVEYEVSFTCGEGAPDGVELVLVSGPESGSVLPLGTTTVTHHLIDGEGNFVSACSFNVTVEDAYCATNANWGVEPITLVDFAGLNNVTSADPSEPLQEFFLAQTAEVVQGSTYPIALEGYTGGDFVNFFTVYIDFDGDNVFNETDERFEIGSISNSTGTDGQQATGEITIPADAPTGVTRMRVSKNWDSFPGDACATLEYGQTEDYSIEILMTSSVRDTDVANLNVYPNPAQDVLNISADETIETVSVFNTNGQLIFQENIETNKGRIDVSGLTPGVYAVTFQSARAQSTFKIVKL
jgi:hypothetical protein